MLNFFGGRRDQVEEHVAQGQYGKAVQILKQRLGEEPTSIYLRQRLAEVLEADGRAAEAIPILLELVDEHAEGGYVARSFALLKKVRRMDPKLKVDDRLKALRAGSDDEELSMDSRSGFATSEIVLSDWVAEAEMRDDFHWSPLLAELSEQELASVFGELRLVIKNPGAIIYATDEPGGGLFVLASGRARVYKVDESGRCHQVRMLKGGDFFGIDSVLNRGPRRHTVTAAEPCELLEMDRGLFDRLTVLYPKIRTQVERLAAEMDMGVRD